MFTIYNVFITIFKFILISKFFNFKCPLKKFETNLSSIKTLIQ